MSERPESKPELEDNSPLFTWQLYRIMVISLAIFSLGSALIVPKGGGWYFGQMYFWIWFLISFVTFPPISRHLSKIPMPHAVVTVLVMALLIGGHFTNNNFKYFPIMAWAIFPYSFDLADVKCGEMIGIHADKTETRLLVEQIIPSIVQFDLPRDLNDPRMPATIQAIAHEYNLLHPANPVVTVEIREFSVPIRPQPGEKPTWTTLTSFTVSSDPSKS